MANDYIISWFRSEPKQYKYSSEMFSATKQLIVFLCGWLGFKVIAAVAEALLLSFAKSYSDTISYYGLLMTINSTSYITLLLLLILVSNVDLAKLAKSFTQIYSILAGIGCVLSIFAFTYLYSFIVALLKTPVTNNINQASLVSLESLFPVGSLIVFGFIGPICEELTYRVGLFSFCKRKSRVLAYAVTIVIFSFIHFNFSTTSLLNEILNLPYYAFAAVAFAFTYERFGFAASLTGHILNNVISLAFVSLVH